MLKIIGVIAVLLIVGYFLVDLNIVNLGQVENVGSSILDWVIEQYQKAKDVVFGETA